VTPGDPGAALAAARAAVARLDPTRHGEALAADLLDAWAAVEAALRQLVSGTGAAGTELVREARQRQLLTFDQANALAAFHAVREHTREADYRPSGADVDVARLAVAALDGAFGAAASTRAVAAPPAAGPGAAPAFPPPDAFMPPGMRRSPLGVPEYVPPPEAARARRGLWIAFAAVVAVGLAAAGAYYWFGGPRRDAVVRQAITEYEAGQRDAASADFRRALLLDPGYAIAHVYLARIARDAGNLPGANEELQLALTADPANAIALREMGAYLFTAGNYELARKFYVRAVSANPDDAAAKGFLGCTLVRLGRIDEGERWITRAGPGVWTSCVSGATPPDSVAR
jgi:tetratricopeptide (TPR) repeat protein